MKRREFITLLVVIAVARRRAAIAQTAAKMRRIGVLLLGSQCPPPTTLVESLAALGWIEGQTVAFDCVSAFGRFGDVPTLAVDLVARHPDVIASGFLSAIAALKAATTSIPIVMLNSADPVRFGLVDSLSRPGGNVTGVASALGELDGKRIELLKELLPKLGRLAIVGRQGGGLSKVGITYYGAVEKRLVEAASAYGFSHQWFDVVRGEDLPPLFGEIASKGFDAIYPVPGPLTELNAALIAQSAQAVRLPTIGYTASHAKEGMLLSYGSNVERNTRLAASYINKILRGAKPSDLPVEQPTEFDLLINLKTAKALGLTVPPSLLARADEVIE
jgi:putative tryptophan/tyrosine transport system substrate-binding protein